MLFLNRNEVEALLDLDQLIEAMSPAMVALSKGALSMPPRIAAMVSEHSGLLGVMPVYAKHTKILSTKLVSVFPNNATTNLPVHQALVVVFDSSTGTPLAVMDGTFITAMRTAAASALATQLLARPDADVLTIIGAGVQGRAHARLIPRVRTVREVRIIEPNNQRAKQLAQAVSTEFGIPVESGLSCQDAMKGCGIVCIATSSKEPVVMGKWLKPGVHLNSVGLNPHGRELDAETIMKSRLVVESRQAALADGPGGANDLTWPIRDGLITADHIHADVGEIILGTREGRRSREQITLYKSVGVGVQDAVAAQLVLSAAQQNGVGLEVAL
ncbi:MAG: ornithine cyclodeaminase family protein [Cyanobacteria bacterium P01_F01_bin.3]